MNTDFEQLLRDDLSRASDLTPVPDPLDAVLRRGTQLRRARTARLATASVAVISTVALGAWWMSQGQGTTPHPAVPLTTPSATAATPVATATFKVSELNWPNTSDNPLGDVATVVVEVDRAALQPGATPSSRPTLRYYTVSSAGGKGPVVGSDVTGLSGATWGSGSTMPRVTVGVVRGAPTWLDILYAEGGNDKGTSFAQTPIGDTGLTAILVTHSRQSDVGLVQGMIWGLPDGTVRDSDGATVPSTSFGTGDLAMTVYRSASKDAFGVHGPGTGVWGRNEGRVVQMNFWSDARQTTAGVLPKGAHDVTATLAPGATLVSIGEKVVDGIDGRVFLAQVNSSKAGEQGILTLTYTDAAGKRVTIDPSK